MSDEDKQEVETPFVEKPEGEVTVKQTDPTSDKNNVQQTKPPVEEKQTVENPQNKPETKVKTETKAKPKETPTTSGESIKDHIRGRNRRKVNQELQELQQIASTLFTQSSIGNVFIGQGQHLYNPDIKKSERVHFTGLDPEEITILTQVYLKPKSYDVAYRCLNEKHWVILQGRPQIGKRAAALYMAFELQGEKPDVQELSPETNLKTWGTSGAINENSIYFIDSIIGVHAQELKAYDWRALRNILANKNSYLIISVKEGVRFAADMPTGTVHNWVPPGNAKDLIRKHLQLYHIPSAKITELLEEPQVVGLIEGQPTPGRVKALAERLRAHAIGEITSLSAALQGFVVYDEKMIRERFGSAKDNDERAFRIALAVFSGARYRLVEEAAAALAALFPSPPKPKKKEDTEEEDTGELFDSLFEEDDKVERAQAVISKADPTEDQPIPSEIITFRDSTYQPALLTFVWQKLRKLRPYLLEWLYECSKHRFGDMRMRTAAAVAFLAQHEFDTVTKDLLIPWANEEDRIPRQTLGYTFASLIGTEQYADATIALLRHWTWSKHKPWVWAAARAYGVIGPTYPKEAMDRWLDILLDWNFIGRHVEEKILETLQIFVDDEMKPLFDSLFDAISTFLINALTFPKDDFIRIYKQILSSLRDWIDLKDRELFSILIAIPLFDEIMGFPIAEDESETETEKKEASKETEIKYAPALLVLADACEPDDPCIQDLAWLLSVAIRTKSTRRLTVNFGLYYWLTYVERDPHLFDALERILQELVKEKSFNHRRWHREIGRPFENWAGYSKNPLSVAGKLVKRLGIQR